MKIATFNINGVKARIETLCDWLDDSAPDVAILQEIKSVDEGFPREMIEDHIWNYDYEGGTNVVDVYVSYLRRKIDDGRDAKLIRTVRGRGYQIKDPED